MKFISTRKKAKPVGLSDAITHGLAPDGGLYIPDSIPQIDWQNWPQDYTSIAQLTLSPYFSEDPLSKSLPTIVAHALNFPLKLNALKDDTSVLELFHGPTAAFKDFGARFLAECFKHLPSRQRTILVATSGDTGGAVASAFYQDPQTEVGVLFPKGRVSLLQERQLTCWGGNIHSFSVRGSFDDCQRMVKDAFREKYWTEERGLTSANSINIGRLLPQITYYAAASIWYYRQTHEQPNFVIPTGNLGNAMAAFYAREMGLPINKITLATNANPTLSEFFATDNWIPRPSIATLASAMDVGHPSNMERLFALFPDKIVLRKKTQTILVTDSEIEEVIRHGPIEWQQVWCPHTATAVRVRGKIGSPHWIVVATAHPAKFNDIVGPLIGKDVPMPPALFDLLSRPTSVTEISADLSQMKF